MLSRAPAQRSGEPTGDARAQVQRVLTVVTAVLLVALAGCAPAEPASSPAPAVTPSALCTPLFGGDPYACEQEELDDLTADRARYDEAAALYEDVTRQIEDLLAAKEPISDEVASHLTGNYLKSMTERLSQFAASGAVVSGHREFAWIRPLSRSNLGSDLALEVCTDPGDLTAVNGDRVAERLHLIDQVFFVVEGEDLKISSSKGAEVASC